MVGPTEGRSRFEILLNGPTHRARRDPLSAVLERIGIEMTIRTVDSSQFINAAALARLRRGLHRLGPVDVARQRTARLLGLGRRRRRISRNYAGIKDPAVSTR
jgi:microcin C transport system substrate-binding protein